MTPLRSTRVVGCLGFSFLVEGNDLAALSQVDDLLAGFVDVDVDVDAEPRLLRLIAVNCGGSRQWQVVDRGEVLSSWWKLEEAIAYLVKLLEILIATSATTSAAIRGGVLRIDGHRVVVLGVTAVASSAALDRLLGDGAAFGTSHVIGVDRESGHVVPVPLPTFLGASTIELREGRTGGDHSTAPRVVGPMELGYSRTTAAGPVDAVIWATTGVGETAEVRPVSRADQLARLVSRAWGEVDAATFHGLAQLVRNSRAIEIAASTKSFQDGAWISELREHLDPSS